MAYLLYEYKAAIIAFSILNGIGFLISAAIASDWECIGKDGPYESAMGMAKFCGMCTLIGVLLCIFTPTKSEMIRAGYKVFNQIPIQNHYYA